MSCLAELTASRRNGGGRLCGLTGSPRSGFQGPEGFAGKFQSTFLLDSQLPGSNRELLSGILQRLVRNLPLFCFCRLSDERSVSSARRDDSIGFQLPIGATRFLRRRSPRSLESWRMVGSRAPGGRTPVSAIVVTWARISARRAEAETRGRLAGSCGQLLRPGAPDAPPVPAWRGPAKTRSTPPRARGLRAPVPTRETPAPAGGSAALSNMACPATRLRSSAMAPPERRCSEDDRIASSTANSSRLTAG